jgi:hypothetical protein
VTFMALFIRLIIYLFQLIFSAGTIFFSHNKSANCVFQPTYQHSRTAPISPNKFITKLYSMIRLIILIYLDKIKNV